MLTFIDNKSKITLPFKVALLTGLTFSAITAQAKNKEVSSIDFPTDSRLTSLLKSSKGKLSPLLKKTYLKKQKAAVLADLSKRGIKIDQNLLSWIDKDSDATDAVYGTVCPSDPNILMNLNQLWIDQGSKFTQKYKHLSLAAAVARRGVGVGPLASFGKWGHLYKVASEARNAGLNPAEELLKGKDKTSHLLPSTPADLKAAKAVSNYLKDEKINHRQVIESESHFQKIESILKENGSKMRVIHIVKGLLITEGLRPPERTQTPKVADYYKFLVKINETPKSKLNLADGQRWPLFPTTTAPWPIMMPLTHGIPLDEAQFIWEKYQGQHGEKRLHNYGPYRKGKKAFHPTFDDRPWHWSSYPATIKEGGVCGTMSTIAMQAYTALGKPMLKAGQPGHSCLVGYSVSSDGKFIAGVGQSVSAGPDGTGTNWLFQDGSSWKCHSHNTNAVHHYGLALAMNPGLSSYMDSRIALHIYRHLNQKDRTTIGSKLLMNSLERNPFNTEVWYTLAKDAPDMKSLTAILSKIDTLLISSAASEKAEDQGDASQALDTKAKGKKSSAVIIATYKRYVSEAIAINAFANPYKFSLTDQKKGLDYLTKVKGTNREIDLAYDRFRSAIKGPKVLMQEIETQIETMLSGKVKGRKGKKRLAGTLKKRFEQVDGLIPNRKLREEWLLKILNEYPQDKAASKNKAGKVKIETVYQAIINALNKSYKLDPQNKAGKKDLQKIKKELLKKHA